MILKKRIEILKFHKHIKINKLTENIEKFDPRNAMTNNNNWLFGTVRQAYYTALSFLSELCDKNF